MILQTSWQRWCETGFSVTIFFVRCHAYHKCYYHILCTPNEHIEYISFPQLHFEEQAKDCLRLMAVMNEIENNK